MSHSFSIDKIIKIFAFDFSLCISYSLVCIHAFLICLMPFPTMFPFPFLSVTHWTFLGNGHLFLLHTPRKLHRSRDGRGLFEFQTQIKNPAPSSPLSLFIFPFLLPKWCQWQQSYRAIYRITPIALPAQNHVVSVPLHNSHPKNRLHE